MEIKSSNGDEGYHLHTAHSLRQRSALDDYNQSWLEVSTVYSSPGSDQSEIQNEYERSGALPFTYIEGYYENEHSITAAEWKGQALRAYLGGAKLGHIFGNCPIWSFGAATNFCDNASYTWSNRLGAAGSVSMTNIAKLIKSRAWWELDPDYANTVVTSSKETGANYHATARTSDGITVMVWCPNTNRVTVDMTKVSGNEAKCWWWSPEDNSSLLIGTYNTTGTRDFKPISARRVLVLDDSSKNLAGPGTTVYSTDIVPPSTPRNLRILYP